MNFFKGYYSYVPTIPIYPNNEKDLTLLKNEMSERNHGINLFFSTNESVVSAFKPYE